MQRRQDRYSFSLQNDSEDLQGRYRTISISRIKNPSLGKTILQLKFSHNFLNAKLADRPDHSHTIEDYTGKEIEKLLLEYEDKPFEKDTYFINYGFQNYKGIRTDDPFEIPKQNRDFGG